jgi:predicted ATPase/DNA-binding SARP family transcriptional activator
MVEFRILGPLEVVHQGQRVSVGAAKEQALLAVLLLHAGEVVSRERLIDELWGESPPQTAAKAVNVRISQLRKALATDNGHPIATRSGGYALDVDAALVDATTFENLLADARARAAPGDLEFVGTILRDALSLWRGPALAGIALESNSRHEVQRLEELRLAALHDRIDCDLALGRHEHVVAELEALVAEHPLRERLRGQYMLALYRSGRQADALRAFQDARQLLVDALGLEPSPALLRLQKAILNPDRALDAPAGIGQTELEPRRDDATGAATTIGVAVADAVELARRRAPHLPGAPSILIGRRRELDELASLLTGPARLVTVTGPGGIGKTRLALAAAEKVADTFAEGARFVSLAALPHERHVAAAVASPFGVRDFDELDEREALLVVDNFEHLVAAAPVVSALLAAAPQSKALVTSRSPLRIAGEIEYPLAPLDEDDALALFADRASAVRPAFAADDASREICRRLDCLPLALELAAPHLRSLQPAALLERLQRRLPLLSDGRRDAPARQRTLRATIAWSYTLLDPNLQTRFAQLSVFAGTFSLGAAEAVVGATLDQVERLVEASLLTPVGDDRFFMLETIREFASEQVDAHDLEATRADHAGFFAAVAESAGLTVGSDAPMEHSRAVTDLDNFRAALDWHPPSSRRRTRPRSRTRRKSNHARARRRLPLVGKK